MVPPMRKKPHSIPTPARTVAYRLIDGKFLLLDSGHDQVHSLNDVGTYVWGLISQRKLSIEAIAEAMVDEFDVDLATAESDLNDFLDRLERDQFVTYVS